jgi:ASC-1-like (ASCH) protein
MQTITKKIYPEYFQQILDGKKKFEVRLNDFDIEEGDLLLLREWNPETKDYTGREITKTVGYVGKWKLEHFEKFWDKKDIDEKGLMVISLLE